MRTEERYDEDGEPLPPWADPRVDGAWLRTANPNTVDGELQNLAAFGDGLVRLTGPRRQAAKIVVWMLLLSTAATIIFGIVGIIGMW
jgi:hypothetical protein